MSMAVMLVVLLTPRPPLRGDGPEGSNRSLKAHSVTAVAVAQRTRCLR